MNIVIQTLREHITDPGISFVFPSEIAASLWARKTCTFGIARSVAAKRFLAWDRFKEEVVRKRETNREPVSLVMRKLFAEALLRKNAEAARGELNAEGFPLCSLVPPKYAEGGAVFASFISRLLPSLSLWERLVKNSSSGATHDGEDRDLELVKKEYAGFLERHNLFEPSWEEINVHAGNFRYVIFFPELVEDFAEYDALLEPPQFIRVEAKHAVSEAETPALVSFASAREEIRSAVMEMRRLHGEEGVPYEDMAVSVPELEDVEPYLIKECTLRHIPVTRRAGKKLGETGAGRFFPLASECASSRFSFDSIKALVLNDHIPWKEREKNKSLVNFGIKYNCVSGYVQDGIFVDIWEEAFREAYNDGGRKLKSYYDELKKRILALSGSLNFADVRKNYFVFRNRLLDMENIAEEDNAVLSRCVEELSSLVELEEKLDDPVLVPSSPFAFFISCLGEKEYVLANQKPGINIFRWRVAAAAPFACHFALNASQSAASVLYQPMKFLRQDKRKLLGFEDKDASGAFFLLCDTGRDDVFKSRCRISASVQAFSGWAIPHSFFARGKIVEAPQRGNDPYSDERHFWRELHKYGDAAGARLAAGKTTGSRTPDSKTTDLWKIFPLQKKSFDFWKHTLVQKKNGFSFLVSPVSKDEPARALLLDAVLGSDGFLTVTPTRDLNVYYECAQKWLYKRIFHVERFSLEAALLDDTSLGLLYHTILENLFARIKNEDAAFDSRRLDIYKIWTLEITKSAIKEHHAFKGPLAVPLVAPQAAGMAGKIARLLELEAKFFNGYRVESLELRVSFKTGDILVNGVIDRVSVTPNGEPVIIDYKTRYVPGQTAPEDLEEDGLSEFQMPLYIKLYEESAAEEVKEKLSPENFSGVQGACFYNITDRVIKTVMGEINTGRIKVPSREEYEPFLNAAEKQIEEFAYKVKALDFVPRKIWIKNCLVCEYKTICRSVYFGSV